jgi:hypothetical protein
MVEPPVGRGMLLRRLDPGKAQHAAAMTRRQVAVLHALLVLITIVALALVTTWALLAIGEGTAAINLRKYGAEFTFGGTLALFIGLIGIFVKTLKDLLHLLIIVLLTVVLSTQFHQMSGEEIQTPIPAEIIKYNVYFMAILFVILAITVWIILKPWRWDTAKQINQPPKQ